MRCVPPAALIGAVLLGLVASGCAKPAEPRPPDAVADEDVPATIEDVTFVADDAAPPDEGSPPADVPAPDDGSAPGDLPADPGATGDDGAPSDAGCGDACPAAPFTFAVAADMRNYAGGPDACVVEFVVPVTAPLAQEYVWLTGSFTGWVTTLEEGAIALTKQDDVWTTEVQFEASASVEYKYLMKWADTGQQWCNQVFDCAPGSPNEGLTVDCTAVEYDTVEYFRGACQAAATHGQPPFMLSPGDVDPPDRVAWTIAEALGPDVDWYPVVGNHEIERQSHMDWLRSHNAGGDSLPRIVNLGPAGTAETTYSFDQGAAHFVVLNQYFDGASDVGSDGDVGDALFDWLAADLAATDKPFIFVSGHEPAYPQPDADWGRVRHLGDSLNQHPEQRDRFWELLVEHRVVAYLCGHTHNFSAVPIDGVWQVDVGHARGAGDTGAPSTYLLIHVDPDGVRLEAFRDVHAGAYTYTDIVHHLQLAWPWSSTLLRFQDGLYPAADYAGTRDTELASDDPDGAFGTADVVQADGDPDRAILLAWDLAAVAPTTQVDHAAITVSISNKSGVDRYHLYALQRPWDEATATWNQAAAGAAWEAPGAAGPGDRGADLLGSVGSSSTGRFVFNLNAAGIAIVQGWLADPTTNHGLILVDETQTDGLGIQSREASDPEDRPRLALHVH